MNIWLIYPYGSIPGEGMRPDRPNMVADALARAGHEVTWWGSAIDHRSKTVRTTEWKDIAESSGVTIRLVPTTGYTKNISLQRIRSEQKYAQLVYLRAPKYPAPDVIVMSEPALFRSGPILKLASETNAKLVLDVLDLWPELFHMLLAGPLAKLGPMLFAPLYARRRALFQRADAIVASSESYRGLARALAPRLPAERMATVYFGIDVAEQRSAMGRSAELPLAIRSLTKSEGEVWAICATTLGSNYGLETLLQAAKVLEAARANVKILIVGEGPLREYVVAFIRDNGLKQTLYLGHHDADTVSRIYGLCDIGLSVYQASSTVTMPIKAFQYFAAGLPVINSLRGDVSEVLERYDAGLQYEAGDAESLAGVLRRVASNKERRSAMARNSYDAATHFDHNVQYPKFVALVEGVLANT